MNEAPLEGRASHATHTGEGAAGTVEVAPWTVSPGPTALAGVENGPGVNGPFSAGAPVASSGAVPDDEDWDEHAWAVDGSNGHYHDWNSLCLVVLAQIVYMVSLVIIIPTAAGYAETLGNSSGVYFGLVIGISSIINPFVSRLWNSVLKLTSLRNVLLMNAFFCCLSSLLYVTAKYAGGDVLLLVSRCLLGLGSVQTANLRYLGCAVSTKKVRFTHFLTTAAIAYGFAIGTLLAFLLSVVANRMNWDQDTLPGYFTAVVWLIFIILLKVSFVEPDMVATIVGPESKIRLNKGMRPERRREPFFGLVPCFIAIFVVAVVKGAFEVMTIEITRDLWQWPVMTSALFLGGVMLVVALTTLLAYRLERALGEAQIFLGGLSCAALLLPFYYIPVSVPFHDRMGSTSGMVVYLIVSILALSALNIGRTIAFSLTTELPSPHWRNYFLSVGSEIFTVGRGIGPILAGALEDKSSTITVLMVGSLAAALAVAVAFVRGAFAHEEHELGPARAEAGDEEEDIESWVRSMDEWLFKAGSSGVAPAKVPSFRGLLADGKAKVFHVDAGSRASVGAGKPTGCPASVVGVAAPDHESNQSA